MNFWESLLLSPEWPLWQFIIGTLIAIFAILVIMLVWKIIEKLQEKKIMSSLLKGADKGLLKAANVDESENIMGQVGQVIGSQANQVISTVQQYAMVNAARNQASENQQNIKDIQEATSQAIKGFNKQSDKIDKLGRGRNYSEHEVANISLNYTVSSSDISQSVDQSVESNVDRSQQDVELQQAEASQYNVDSQQPEEIQQNVETQQTEVSQQNVDSQQAEEISVSESVDEPLMQQPEVDFTNASLQADETWVKTKVLDFQCVKSQLHSYNLDDDWTFRSLCQRAFMEIYKIFNQKRAEQNPSDDVVKIHKFLLGEKVKRGF